MSYKVVFAGNPSFATYALESLISDKRFFVSSIITEVDKKIGRKQILTPTPVKVLWKKNNIHIHEAKNSWDIINILKKEKPDFFVVVAYWHILAKQVLSIAKFNINIHFSLLPKYRWASPVQSSILNWDKETWISIMNIEEKMDAWKVWKQIVVDINPQDTSESVFNKLWKITFKLADILDEIISLKLNPKIQDEIQATYCKKIKKEDWLIYFKKENAETIFNKIKAFTPWPWTYCFYKWKKLKLIKASIDASTIELKGSIWEIIQQDSSFYIKTKDWFIEILEIQLEWKKVMNVLDFVKWHGEFVWTVLD